MPFTRLRYHFVSRTYDRHPLITPEVERVLYPAMQKAALANRGKILAANGTDDHVHIVAAIRPSMSVSHFIGAVKSQSSHAVRHVFSEDTFRWQSGYSAFTLRSDNYAACLAYVRNQKQHHAEGSTRAAWERLDAEE